ncbi:MAG: alpha-hydroxy-acid oxidizing protein [Desulfobacteraceae bacterium]
MNQWYCSICHADLNQETRPEACDSCGADSRVIMSSMEEKPDSVEGVRDSARKKLKKVCAAYPFCDGNYDRICQREAYGGPIGFGGAGAGHSFYENVAALSRVKLKTSVVGDHFEPDTGTDFLGIPLDFPVLSSSSAGVEKYNDCMDETDFCRAVVAGSKEAGTIALRGDTASYTLDDNPSLTAIGESGGWGIPIFKPREQSVLKKLLDMAEENKARAVGVDLDGCGSTIMARMGQPTFKKSIKDIRELVEHTNLPFIAKGIMTPEDAEMCAEAGVSVVAVSNHGGRVLDSTPGTADVLPAIKERLGDRVLITADGGVRTGYDVFKMIALGADAVLLGRDIIRAAVGGGTLGVKLHLEHVHKVLRKAMFMTGTRSLETAADKIIF